MIRPSGSPVCRTKKEIEEFIRVMKIYIGAVGEHPNFLPLDVLGQHLNATPWAQITYFYNPVRKIFFRVGYSILEGLDPREIESFKAVMPQYEEGPLVELVKAFDSTGSVAAVFYKTNRLSDTNMKSALEQLRFTSFMAIPIVCGNHFYGAVVICFIKPERCGQHHSTDNPHVGKRDLLTEIVQVFFTPRFRDMSLRFELAQGTSTPIPELGLVLR